MKNAEIVDLKSSRCSGCRIVSRSIIFIIRVNQRLDTRQDILPPAHLYSPPWTSCWRLGRGWSNSAMGWEKFPLGGPGTSAVVVVWGGACCSVLSPVLGLRFKTFCEVHGVLSGPGRDAPVQTVSIYISKGLNYFHLMIDEYFLPASYHHHQAVHLAPGSSNYRTLECCYLEGERGKNTTRCSPLICILTQSTQSWAKQMILLNSFAS